MKQKDYHVSIMLDATPEKVFNDINNISKWWSTDLEGSSQKLGDEFTVHFGDVHHSTQKLIEVVPGKKVVWLVTSSKLNFLKDKSEWTDTKISFEISNDGRKTQLNFTHFGLLPQVECYKDCVRGWDYYINGSLLNLLNTGTGQPNEKEK